MDADFRRRAALLLVPFGRGGDQFAVAVAAGDVGHHGRRQRRRLVDLLAALGDRAFVGEFAQDALQLDAVGVLQAELARDLAGADLSRMRADEGDDGVPVRKAAVALLGHSIRWPCRRFLRRRFRRLCAALAGEVLAVGRHRRARLAGGIGFRLCRGLSSPTAFLAGFGAFGRSRPWRGFAAPAPSWRRASACRRPWPRARRSARWLPAA